MNKKALFITLVAVPGKRDELWQLWQKKVQPYLEKIDEAKSVVPCFDLENKDVIRLFELFSDEEIPQKIMDSEWFQSFFSEIKPILKDSSAVAASPMWEKE